MSTPDQPETPPLTRRQMREIRNTGSTPVLTPEDIAENEATLAANEAAAAATVSETDAAEPTVSESEPHGATDERDEDVAQPAIEFDAGVEPADTSSTNAESSPSSIASVLDAAPADASTGDEPEPAEERSAEEAPVAPRMVDDLGVAPLTRRQAREHERIRTASVPIITPDAEPARSAPGAPLAAPFEEPAVAGPVDDTPAIVKSRPDDVIAEVPGAARGGAVTTEAAPTAIVNPHFGSGLLAGETPVVDLPPSFDQLISRTGSTGVSSSTPNALILSQTPSVAPLVAPVTATGEVLITGSFDLPEGLGSVGHAPGIHDGKDVDAVLVDGELPAASSPTPIAASAAISQVRNNDEIIRPPAPEKGSKLVLILGITAGVLGLVLIGALALVFTTGVL